MAPPGLIQKLGALWIAAAILGSPTLAEARDLERQRMQQPMLLHDRHHTGNSPYPAPARGEVLWTTFLTGSILASPAVDARGRTYWSTRSGDLHVLSPSGSVIWSVALGDSSHSTPALDSHGNIYTATREGRVAAHNDEGELIWAREMGRDILSSPLVDEAGEQLILSIEDRTVSIDLSTGRLRFVYIVGNKLNNSSPSLGPDGLVRVVNWGGEAVSISGTGRRVWSVDLGSGGFWAAPTLGSFGTLYTAGASGFAVAISPGGRIVWQYKMDEFESVSGFLALTPEGRLLVPVTRSVIALSPKGERVWIHGLGEDSLRTSLSVSKEGHILFGTERGAVRSLDKEGQLNWSTQLARTTFNSSVVIAAPVMGVPRAYLGSLDGHVFCLH